MSRDITGNIWGEPESVTTRTFENPDPVEWINAAQKSYNQGDFDTAVERLEKAREKALKLKSEDKDLIYLIATILILRYYYEDGYSFSNDELDELLMNVTTEAWINYYASGYELYTTFKFFIDCNGEYWTDVINSVLIKQAKRRNYKFVDSFYGFAKISRDYVLQNYDEDSLVWILRECCFNAVVRIYQNIDINDIIYSLDEQNDIDFNALALAIYYKRNDIAVFFCQNKLVKDKDFNICLLASVLGLNYEGAVLSISNGANVNKKYQRFNYRTVLSIIATNRHWDDEYKLLYTYICDNAPDIDINSQDADGNTALFLSLNSHIFFFSEEVDMINYLLKKYSNSIDFSIKNNEGYSIFDYKQMYGSIVLPNVLANRIKHAGKKQNETGLERSVKDDDCCVKYYFEACKQCSMFNKKNGSCAMYKKPLFNCKRQ